MTKHGNPGFWSFYAQTMAQIRLHPKENSLWINKLRQAIKTTEPNVYHHIQNTKNPSTWQELMERLIADHGKPNHYQRILEAAFNRMGKLNKLNPANCEALTEKLGVIICIFANIRIMEKNYTAKYVGDPLHCRVS